MPVNETTARPALVDPLLHPYSPPRAAERYDCEATEGLPAGRFRILEAVTLEHDGLQRRLP